MYSSGRRTAGISRGTGAGAAGLAAEPALLVVDELDAEADVEAAEVVDADDVVCDCDGGVELMIVRVEQPKCCLSTYFKHVDGDDIDDYERRRSRRTHHGLLSRLN